MRGATNTAGALPKLRNIARRSPCARSPSSTGGGGGLRPRRPAAVRWSAPPTPSPRRRSSRSAASTSSGPEAGRPAASSGRSTGRSAILESHGGSDCRHSLPNPWVRAGGGQPYGTPSFGRRGTPDKASRLSDGAWPPPKISLSRRAMPAGPPFVQIHIPRPPISQRLPP